VTDFAPLAERFRWQAGACEGLGSPLYGGLCRRTADDIEAGGPLRQVLAGHEDDPRDSMLQLRLLGAVHRLALSGRAPALAACYPSTGGGAAPAETWRAFRETVAERAVELAELIERPVQTNEVGRSRALAPGFLLVARLTGLPLRMLELGTSGGLNLRWDHFRYEAGGLCFGDEHSPVRFSGFHEGEPLPAPPARLEITERAGCDEHPVDASTPDGRETLRAYLWPDQSERFRLLDAALEVANAVPATVERSEALPWLIDRLAQPAPGACTVVFHSIVMQYVDERQREAIDHALAEAGSRATPDAPLARLALEPAGNHADLRLTTWPGGEERLLAKCGYHGTPVRWL
jgi:hypothetical protein